MHRHALIASPRDAQYWSYFLVGPTGRVGDTKVPLIQKMVTIPPKVVGSNWLKMAQSAPCGAVEAHTTPPTPATLADSPLEATHAPFGP